MFNETLAFFKQKRCRIWLGPNGNMILTRRGERSIYRRVGIAGSGMTRYNIVLHKNSFLLVHLSRVLVCPLSPPFLRSLLNPIHHRRNSIWPKHHDSDDWDVHHKASSDLSPLEAPVSRRRVDCCFGSRVVPELSDGLSLNLCPGKRGKDGASCEGRHVWKRWQE